MRHLSTQQEIWMGSIYVSLHYSTVDVQGFLEEHFAQLPGTTLPTILTADVNAGIKWQQLGNIAVPHGGDSKAKVVIDTLMSRGLHITPPKEEQLHQATSRPRREFASGRAIDWVAVTRVDTSRVRICMDSCREIGTDHDCITTELTLNRPPHPRIRSGVRVVKSTPVLGERIDQIELQKLAATHTGGPKSRCYKDTAKVKAPFRRARATRNGADWCAALRGRRFAHKQWKENLILDATNGNWKALKESKGSTNVGWETSFAEKCQPDDPHSVLHRHYEKLFDKGKTVTQRSKNPVRSQDITEEELHDALRSGKLGKSTGEDGVSLELLRAIAEVPEGSNMLVAWYNSLLHSGVLPANWKSTLMVLLPKIQCPILPKQTRPICIGSAAETTFCRIILTRCEDKISLTRPWQCSGKRRQCGDYLFTIHRLMELDREWSKGLCVLILDLSRAFDSVDRDVLLSQLFARLGDTEEYRIWETLMVGTSCTLRSPWSQSNFATNVGIRQGAIESPCFFRDSHGMDSH